MTAYLDESAPVRLSRALAALGCRVVTFPEAWKGLKNGALLARLRDVQASCLVTCDKNLQHQQTIATSELALIVLPYQRFGDLEPLLASIIIAIDTAKPGTTIEVGRDGKLSGL